jgi:Phage tail protein (Tail_P2_I)
MDAGVTTLPESLSYLPAFFRAEVEPSGVVAHHPIRWVLQVFETNLHLAERMIEASRMLFDPEEVSLFPGKVCSSTFSKEDIIDLRSFLSRLEEDYPGQVSDFLGQKLASTQKENTNPEPVQDALIRLLNKVIQSEGIYVPVRFATVRFSDRTKALLKRQPQGEAARPWSNSALVHLNRLLIEDAYPLEVSAKPESSLLKFDNWEVSWLHWLASWVKIALDQQWLDDANGRHEKALKVIKEAPQLYRLRGTRKGLTEMLALLYDEDVEILERSWPRGFEIGVSSAIGLDCWLIDEINLDFQFTVLIRSTERNRDLLLEVGSRIVSELAGSNAERQIAWISIDSAAQPANDKEHAERSTISRLRQLIDQEKPAHTCYYLALESSKTPEKPQLPPLVIGVDSIVEGFWID